MNAVELAGLSVSISDTVTMAAIIWSCKALIAWLRARESGRRLQRLEARVMRLESGRLLEERQVLDETRR